MVHGINKMLPETRRPEVFKCTCRTQGPLCWSCRERRRSSARAAACKCNVPVAVWGSQNRRRVARRHARAGRRAILDIEVTKKGTVHVYEADSRGPRAFCHIACKTTVSSRATPNMEEHDPYSKRRLLRAAAATAAARAGHTHTTARVNRPHNASRRSRREKYPR